MYPPNLLQGALVRWPLIRSFRPISLAALGGDSWPIADFCLSSTNRLHRHRLTSASATSNPVTAPHAAQAMSLRTRRLLG